MTVLDLRLGWNYVESPADIDPEQTLVSNSNERREIIVRRVWGRANNTFTLYSGSTSGTKLFDGPSGLFDFPGLEIKTDPGEDLIIFSSGVSDIGDVNIQWAWRNIIVKE